MKQMTLIVILVLGISKLFSLSITVTSPNGGENIQRGENFEIIWQDDLSENVIIELFKNESYLSTVSGSTESDGSYLWAVPAGLEVDDDYKIKITSTILSSVNDMSDSDFSVFTGAVELTFPNGGELLDKGKEYTITWNDDIYDNVRIELFKGGTLHSNIIYNTESDGSYEWFVPTSLLQDDDYKVKIVSVANDETFDISNNDFFIRGTNNISGEVSGVWKTECSPYIIDGSVTVPDGENLTIEPGVKVLYNTPGAFNVNGSLNAVGTKEQRVEFGALNDGGHWNGIRLINNLSTHFENCRVTNVLNTTWAKKIEGESIYSSITLSDQTIILCGKKDSFQFIKKIDKYGYEIWSKTYEQGVLYSLELVENNIIVGGEGENNILKLDSNGNKLSEKKYGSIIKKIKYYNDSFIICGRDNSSPSKMSMAKIDNNFNILWENIEPNSSYEFSDEMTDFVETNDNSYIFAGSKKRDSDVGSYTPIFIKLSADLGLEEWRTEPNESFFTESIENYIDDTFYLITIGYECDTRIFIIEQDGNISNSIYTDERCIFGMLKMSDSSYLASGYNLNTQKTEIFRYDNELNYVSSSTLSNDFFRVTDITYSMGNGYMITAFENYPVNESFVVKLNDSAELINNSAAFCIKSNVNYVSIQNCEISNNQVTAIYCENSNPTITNNLIHNNTDGAIKLNSSSPIITNNTIINNSSENGGAISFDSSSNPAVMNNIIWGNTASESGNQIYISDDDSDPNFFYNDIDGGSSEFGGSGAGSNFSGQYIENIDSDPQFWMDT